MTNTIALAQNYLAVADEVYKAEAKTIDLDFANSDIEFIGANTAKVAKLSMDGLGNYNRNTGYPVGSVNLAWETLTLENDRGTQLHVDRFDNEETKGIAFGKLAAEFERTQMIPEVDAYTFAKLFAGTGNTVGTGAITVGTTDVPALIEAAEMELNNAEVPTEGRILYVSPKAYAGLKSKITRYLANEGTVNRNVEYFDDMRVIMIPEGRFYSAITLQTGATNFGYVPTTGGYKLNFMIVHPTAVKKALKHVMPKIFSPDVVQGSDSWLLDYRAYYDVFVLENKTKGIYVHRDTTAIS